MSISAIITPGDSRLDVDDLMITRGMTNNFSLVMVNEDDSLPDFSDVSAWELVLTKDFKLNPDVLATTSDITAVSNTLDISINAHTEELAVYLDRRNSAMAQATLKGFDGTGKIVRTYLFLLKVVNVGYVSNDLIVTAIIDLIYTKPQIDAKFDNVAETIGVPTDLSDLDDATGLLTAKEDAVNKVTTLDDPNDTNYPTTQAIISYLSTALTNIGGWLTAVSSIEELPEAADDGDMCPVIANNLIDFYQKTAEGWVLVELSDLEGLNDALAAIVGLGGGDPIWENGKSAYELWLDEGNTGTLEDFFVACGGFTAADREVLNGKVDKDGSKVLSDNNYTNTDAAKVATVNNATLETLSGADVTVAPWGKYRWAIDGVCSITLAGFAALGEEVAKIIITVATGATLSLPSGTVVEEGDVVDAAGVYETYIRVIDSVVYFRVVSFTEAA